MGLETNVSCRETFPCYKRLRFAAFLTAAFAVGTEVVGFFCLLGTDQSLPLCSRFLSRRQEFNSASVNSRIKKTNQKKKQN